MVFFINFYKELRCSNIADINEKPSIKNIESGHIERIKGDKRWIDGFCNKKYLYQLIKI